jgi:hypothetical protein
MMRNATIPPVTERYWPTEARARKFAERVLLPNVQYCAAQTPDGWVGVVQLRPDQRWMAGIVRERHCRPEDMK